MTVGFLWEGYEFLADTFILHKHFIQDGAADTMGDLLADFFGALAYSSFFLFYIRKTKISNF